jgi:hypothetical protein
MPKITVHGGPTNAAAGPSITGGAWGDPPADTSTPVVDAPVESDGEGEPLPTTVEGGGGEHPVDPVFDYDACTVSQLREFLAARPGDLSTDGKKQELIDRLRADDTAQAEKAADES